MIHSDQRKLSIVHTESSTGRGGQEIRILSEAKGMLERGHRVVIACPSDAWLLEEAVRWGVPAFPVCIGRKRPKDFMALGHWLTKQSAPIDVVNTHSSTDSWLMASWGLIRKIPPLIRTRHVSTPLGRGWPTRWLYQHAAAHVVVTGESLRQQLHRHNGIPLAHITSVPTGIDTKIFYRHSTAAEARAQQGLTECFSLGIVATLRSWKGHEFLFSALATLPSSLPWQLLVVGDGPQRQRCEERVRALGIAEKTHFLGHQSSVNNWLNAMDLFVLPSTGNEGVPQAILQAMACQLPVVSTTVGAIAEAVDDQVTGLLIPPRDVPALQQAIATLMHDQERRQRMGQAGGKKIAMEFSRDKMLDTMESIFLRYASR